MEREASTSRGEQTRQAILDSAEGLFLSQGYNGTSIRQIARRAGRIAVGSIYNYFEGKEEIFRALLEDRSPDQEIIATMETAEGETGEALIADAFRRLLEILQDNLSFIGLVMIDFQEFEGRTIRELAGQVIPATLGFGRRLHEVGGLRGDLDEYQVLRSFTSMLMGYIITRLFAYKDNEPVFPGIPTVPEDAWQSQMLDMFLFGVSDTHD